MRANDSIYTFALYTVLGYEAPTNDGSGHVSLVIGSRNGKTAGRLDLSTLLRLVLLRHFVWKCSGRIFCLVFLSFSPSLDVAQRRLSRLLPFRFIRLRSARLIVRIFVHLSVHLSLCSSADTTSRIDEFARIRSRLRDARIVLLFSFGNLLGLFSRQELPLFFLSSCNSRSTFILFKVRISIRGFFENAPLRYYITRE